VSVGEGCDVGFTGADVQLLAAMLRSGEVLAR